MPYNTIGIDGMIDIKIYRQFLEALLAGNKAECHAITANLLQNPQIPIKEIYTDLFQQAMYEVGSLWEKNRISVATEHMATAIVESLLSLAYPRIFGAAHIGRRAVISCVANEYHQIGGKMIADIFELNGWDGYFLGANTPPKDLLNILTEKQPQILGLSLSIFFNMHNLYRIISIVQSDFPNLPILVGGQAFLWGGLEIENDFRNVRYIDSIPGLEQILAEET